MINLKKDAVNSNLYTNIQNFTVDLSTRNYDVPIQIRDRAAKFVGRNVAENFIAKIVSIRSIFYETNKN